MAESNLRPAAIFSDHAVFERNRVLPVWGHGTPGGEVTVTLNQQSVTTRISPDGYFMARFQPQEAGGPYTLTFRSADEELVYQDIYIGEVWLCAGQSNMEFTIANETPQPLPAELDRPLIRTFRVPMAAWPAGRSDVDAAWLPATPENTPTFSATAFHFADSLQTELDVAIGIIDVSYGGTNIAAWLSREALYDLPGYRERLELYDRCADQLGISGADGTPDRGAAEDRFLKQVTPPLRHPEATEYGWHMPDFNDSDWELQNLPNSWALAGYNHQGVFWYRFEFDLPEAFADHDLLLSLGRIDQQDRTWINGVEVGANGGGTNLGTYGIYRRYQIPAEVLRPGRNVLAVRAVSVFPIMLSGGLMGPAHEMFLTTDDDAFGPKMSLAGMWRFKLEQRFEPEATPEQLQLVGAGEAHSLAMMYENMVRPVIPYAIRGVAWYQGEADSISVAMNQDYAVLLNKLRDEFRRKWQDANLEFLIVQLPAFAMPVEYQENLWSLTREAQLQTALADGSYPVVLCDTGDADDMHPGDKRIVGKRLAELTLGLRNQDRARACGPVPTGITRDDDKLVITFDLPVAWRDDKPYGWVVAGVDGIFHSASAQITAETRIEVSSPEVAVPVEVRYGWSINPMQANLTGNNGLPASPFRLRSRE